MSSTDTNQASEDEIRDLLRIIDIESGDEPDSYWIDDNSIEKATAAIQAYIRNEKLKLLAEVRERVVGRNQSLPKRGDFDPDIHVEVIHRVEGRNALRAEQLKSLTKLEAEL